MLKDLFILYTRIGSRSSTGSVCFSYKFKSITFSLLYVAPSNCCSVNWALEADGSGRAAVCSVSCTVAGNRSTFKQTGKQGK